MAAAVGEALAFARQCAVMPEQDECVLWPFSRAGKDRKYGQLVYDGQHTTPHRVICRLAHGEPPTPDHHAAHSCNTPLCCNWKHIRWATPSENEADKIQAGTDCSRRMRNDLGQFYGRPVPA